MLINEVQGQVYTIQAPGELVDGASWTGTGQAVLQKLNMFVSCEGLPGSVLPYVCNALSSPKGLQKRNFDGVVALPIILVTWLLFAYIILHFFAREQR